MWFPSFLSSASHNHQQTGAVNLPWALHICITQASGFDAHWWVDNLASDRCGRLWGGERGRMATDVGRRGERPVDVGVDAAGFISNLLSTGVPLILLKATKWPDQMHLWRWQSESWKPEIWTWSLTFCRERCLFFLLRRQPLAYGCFISYILILAFPWN